jgi:hypothetical protein
MLPERKALSCSKGFIALNQRATRHEKSGEDRFPSGGARAAFLHAGFRGAPHGDKRSLLHDNLADGHPERYVHNLVGYGVRGCRVC